LKDFELIFDRLRQIIEKDLRMRKREEIYRRRKRKKEIIITDTR